MPTCFHLCRSTAVLALSLCCLLTVVHEAAAEERPYVGIIPDFAAQVQGMKVKGVAESGPAHKAGVKAADVITKVDANEIKSLRDFVAAMRFLKIGKKARFVVKRNDNETTVTIVPQAKPAKPAKVVRETPAPTRRPETTPLPSLARIPTKTAEPITLANVNNVGLLSEVKNDAMYLELGPGPNELLLFPRGGISVVDDKNLKLIREIDKDQTRGFTFSQDRSLTSWLKGTKTVVRDEKTGKTVEIDAGKRPGSAVFSPDNKLIAIGEAVTTNPRVEGSGFSVMRVFDTATGELVHKLDTGDKGYGAVRPVFSPNGKLLAVSNRNYETRMFDVATGKQLHEFPKRMTQEIAFSPDGKTLAAAYVDGHLGLWDIESGKELHMVESGCPEIYSVGWNSTGDLLATCSPAGGKHGPNNTFIRMPGKVLLWNAKTFKVAKELMDVRWSGRVRFTRDDTRIVATVRKIRTLDDSPRIAIWSTNAPAIATQEKPRVDVATIPVEHSLSLPPMGIPTVAISPDGKRAFAPLNIKDQLAMWNLSTGEREFVFKGKHGWQISRVAFSPDGSTVATASLDKTAKLWDAKTGGLLATMEGHNDRLKYITYSPTGKYILTSTGKQWPYVPKGPVSARTWDAKTGEQIAEFKTHMDTIRSAKFSPDEKHVLTSSDDHTARLWEVTSGKEVHTFNHKSRILTIDFSPDGKTILTSSSERRSPYIEGIRKPAEPSIKLWDAETGELRLHKPHLQGVTASFNESGNQIITACRGLITCWDIASGKKLTTLREPLIGTHVVFGPNGKYFVVLTPDEPMELWSIPDQKPIARMEIEKPFLGFFSRDSETFYSLTRAGEFRSWSLDGVSARKKQNAELPKENVPKENVREAAAEERPYVGILPDVAAQVKGMKVRGVIGTGPAHRAGIRASDVIIKVDKNEIKDFREFLAATRSFKIGKKVKLVVKRKDKEMTITVVPEARPARLDPPPVKRSPTHVAVDGTVTFGHTAAVRGIAIFPDGKRVVTASWREDYVWELATAKELGQFTGARSLTVAITGDGKRVAIEGFDALTIHDAEKNKELLSFNPHGDWDPKFPFRPTVDAMAFSPDSKLLATAGSIAKVGGSHGWPGGIVKVWDAATGKEIRSFGDLPHRAGSVAFSPDGKLLAAGTFGASSELPDAALFSVWEIGSGKQILSAKMHEKISVTDNPCNVRAVIFHPDGKHVLTGSLDNKLRVWDLASGKLSETREMNRRRSAGIAAFSSDARLLAFGGVRVVSICEVATGKEIKSFPFDVRRIRSLAFSGDNKWLVAGGGDSFRSGQAKAWKIAD